MLSGRISDTKFGAVPLLFMAEISALRAFMGLVVP